VHEKVMELDRAVGKPSGSTCVTLIIVCALEADIHKKLRNIVGNRAGITIFMADAS
jgi:hypothetical protein